MAEMVENATGLVSGQIEIHDAEYRPERSLYQTIGGREGVDVERLLGQVATDAAVVAVAPRVYAGGLVSSGESTRASRLMGIDPTRERAVSRFLDTMVDGFLPEPGRNELAIGSEMARLLSVGVGDELVVVASAADGSMGNDLYSVAGIFQTGMVQLDASQAVLPLRDLQELVMLDPGRIHEIAVTTGDPWVADETAVRLSEGLGAADRAVEVVSWTELTPVINEFVVYMDVVYFVIFLFVFGIAIFGVANTMMMATYERRREIAVMLALGATPRVVVTTVLYEAAAMGLLSLAVGVVVTLPLMLWWQTAPPDLSALYGELTLSGVMLRPVLRVETSIGVWIFGAVALFLTALLAALYPAARAARVSPADTLSEL